MAKLLIASDARDEAFVKALITGASGSGKTTCAAKAPRPLVIEPAAQAVTSIRAANPDAFVYVVEGMQDVHDVLYSLRQAKEIDLDGKPGLRVRLTQDPSLTRGKPPKDYGTIEIQSVVLDDLEEIQELAKADLMGNAPALTQQQWGILLDQNMSILRALRSVRANIFVCAKVLRNEDDGQQVYELALYGNKFKPLLPGLFNCMAFMYRKTPTDRDQREYVAGFHLPEKYQTKGHPALLPVEDPDPALWWDKIREWDAGLNAETTIDPASMPNDYKAPPQMPRRGRGGQAPQEQATNPRTQRNASTTHAEAHTQPKPQPNPQELDTAHDSPQQTQGNDTNPTPTRRRGVR